MKRVSMLICLAITIAWSNSAWSVDATLSAEKIKAGDPITVSGQIEPGKELFVVIATETLFKPDDAIGQKERTQLRDGKNGKNAFGETAIPPNYYVVTSTPEALATPQTVSKGQTSGLFAFPPFKYQVKVNKLKAWGDIPVEAQSQLGPIGSEDEWKFMVFTHEDTFGINTISKELPIGGGNSRAVMTGHDSQQEDWNEGVTLALDKDTGKYAVSMAPYKHIAPDTSMKIWVNGEEAGSFTIEKRGFFFRTANIYMNPLVVFIGAFIIGCLFVIMGAAGGLFTAAFQVTVLGTKGPLGINAANTIKPTNLFLTLCSPITGLMNYFKEKRFAWPVALFFAIGIVIGAFFLGPNFSAKYLPLKAYKFYLGIICLIIGVKLFMESMPGSIEKKKAMKAIVQKFNAAVKEAKSSGKAMELGKVEFEKFNLVKFDMKFWGETFVARPLVMLFSGILMGMIASSFGVGGGFMFMPFMTSVMGYPMYLAVPIALAGTFATSVGGIAKYVLMGYQPDWLMAAAIAAGAIGGGMVGPKIQKHLPEIFLKRMLAIALIITFMNYTQLLWFLR